jgi:translocation and assembly module TamB
LRRLFLLAAVLALWATPAAVQDMAAEDTGAEDTGAEDTGAEERDRGLLVGLIEDSLSTAARRVVIEGFEGALSSRATIDRLTVADRDGVWLEAEDLVLDWNRAALFRRVLDVAELRAGRIAIHRAPLDDPAAPVPEAAPFALPELPVAVEIAALRGDRIELGAALLGAELALNLTGSMRLAGGEGEADLAATIVAGSAGRLDFEAAYANATRILALDLDLAEAEGGLVARALNLPGLPAVELVVAGTAPIDDYTAAIRLATDGIDRVTGDVALQTTRAAAGGLAAARAFGLDLRGDVTPLVAPEARAFFGPDLGLRVKGIRRADGSLSLTSFDIDAAQARLEGAAQISPEGWPLRLALTGEVGRADGLPVRLPGAAGTTVERVALELAYDRAAGRSWTGRFALSGLGLPGLAVAQLSLDGGGMILPAAGAEPGVFTAELAYAARGLAWDNPALQAAVGAEAAGEVALARPPGGGPLRLDRLTLRGPGVEAEGEGTIRGSAEGFATDATLRLEAADLGRFADLAGIDLGGAATLDIEAGLRPLDGAFAIDLAGATSGLALGLAELDPLLGGDGTVALRAARDARGTRLESVRVATAQVTATAAAELTSALSTARFDLDVKEIGLALPGLSGPGRLSGRAEIDGPGRLTLDAALDLPGAMARLRASRPAPAEDAATGLPLPAPIALSLEAEAADLAAFAPAFAPFGLDPGGAARLSLAGQVTDAARFDLAGSAATSDLRLGLARLDALLAGEGRLSGRVARDGLDLTVEGFRARTDLLSARVDALLRGGRGTADIDIAVADVAPVLGGLSGPGRVTGTLRPEREGALDLDLDATLPGGTARVEGRLLTEARRFEGRVAADIADLSPFGALAGRELAGALAFEASGAAALEPTTLDLTVPDFATLDIALEARALGLRLGLPALDPLLAGATTVAGRVARAEDGRLVLDLDLGLPAATAALDGRLDPATGEFRGELAAEAADLAPFGALAGRELGGAATLRATGAARPDLSVLDISVAATTRDLRLGLPQADPLLAGAGSLAGRIERAGGGEGFALSLTARLPRLAAAAEGVFAADGGEGRFDVTLPDIAPLLPGLTGAARATGTIARGAGGGIELAAGLDAPGATARLDATIDPASFEATGTAAIAVAELRPWGALAGRPLGGALEASARGRLRPDLSSFALDVAARARDLDPGDATAARLLAGEGSVTARLSRAGGGPVRLEALDARFRHVTATVAGIGAAGGAEIRFDAAIADLGLLVPELPGPASATGTAAFDAAETRLDAAFAGPGGIAGRVAGRLAQGGADLRATGEAPLALANLFLEPRRLSGTAAFDLALRGPPALAALSGSVAVRDGRLADPALGIAIEAIAGTVALGGGDARVALSGGLAAGGRISATGSVGLAPPFAADLAVAGDGLVLRDPRLYEAEATARLTLTGPLAGGARLAGRIDLGRVEIRVPASTVGTLGEAPPVLHFEPSFPVQETLARAGLATGTDPAAAGPDAVAAAAPIALDLAIGAPGQVFVRGRGLDAEVGGELRLTGTTAAVVPIGQLSLLRGRLDLLGQRFDLAEGLVTLQGDFEPMLRFVAATQARTGLAVRVVLEGPASAPEVRFASAPDLPEDEVIAQLLFGRDLTSLTPFQALQLASAVATLTGRGGGALDRIRGAAGLADLDLLATEEGGAALRLGRYIGENLYTDVLVSPAATAATINLDLTPDVTVRAGVSSSGETTLGITFARDY